jgi:predicted AlkP superfamily phosphohydrolase/phosphomutase
MLKLPFLKKPDRHPPRVAIIGLDCAEPSLVFERYAADLPTLRALWQRGVYGTLESVTPAITVPAWSCMMSGQDPGALGVYGFRNRRDYGYHHTYTATNAHIKQPRLWDLLGAQGKRSIALSVPMTYPPPPIAGALVSCFLAPPDAPTFTHPPALAADLRAWVGEYMADVRDFRTDRKDWLIEQLNTMTERRFEVARRLLDREDWDFFIMVEIGVDRIHHAFWKDMDSTHPKHDPATLYGDAIRDYYRRVDAEIATLLPRFDANTHVWVVSDHGAKRMDGGICLNEWLWRNGYLVLNTPPARKNLRIEDADIDWTRTRAWGDGGYYGRVFLNVRGREPQGIVPPQDVEALRDELAAKLCALGDEHGQPIGTRCFKAEDIYTVARSVPPDLLVYFGDLRWRSIGTLGWDAIHVFENDTGPDDANHAQHGLYIYAPPTGHTHNLPLGQRHDGAHLLQIAPTVLEQFGLSPTAQMRHAPLRWGVGG